MRTEAACEPYTTRIEDLGPGDFVHVECACGHDVLIPPIGLLQGLRLPPYMPVLDLQSRFRCRECDRRGKVVCRSGGLRGKAAQGAEGELLFSREHEAYDAKDGDRRYGDK